MDTYIRMFFFKFCQYC